MAYPTRPEPQKIDQTWPGSKIFDPDPSLNQTHHYYFPHCLTFYTSRPKKWPYFMPFSYSIRTLHSCLMNWDMYMKKIRFYEVNTFFTSQLHSCIPKYLPIVQFFMYLPKYLTIAQFFQIHVSLFRPGYTINLWIQSHCRLSSQLWARFRVEILSVSYSGRHSRQNNAKWKVLYHKDHTKNHQTIWKTLKASKISFLDISWKMNIHYSKSVIALLIGRFLKGKTLPIIFAHVKDIFLLDAEIVQT